MQNPVHQVHQPQRPPSSCCCRSNHWCADLKLNLKLVSKGEGSCITGTLKKSFYSKNTIHGLTHLPRCPLGRHRCRGLVRPWCASRSGTASTSVTPEGRSDWSPTPSQTARPPSVPTSPPSPARHTGHQDGGTWRPSTARRPGPGGVAHRSR